MSLCSSVQRKIVGERNLTRWKGTSSYLLLRNIQNICSGGPKENSANVDKIRKAMQKNYELKNVYEEN